MVVQSKILINKTRGEVHRAGQPIAGMIQYNVSKPTLYRRVTLSILGKGKCMWKEGSSTQKRKHKGTEEYLVMRTVVIEGDEDSIKLEGEYVHPFEFVLPENIPPTYKDKIARVSYYIELEFVKADFSSPTTLFRTEIPVKNYLKPAREPIIFELTKKLFSPFGYLSCASESPSPMITLNANINKSFVTPGENLQISYKVSNETDVKIKSVKTTLFRHTTYRSNDGKLKCAIEKMNTCRAETSSIPERHVSLLTCELPTSPDMCSIKNSKVVSVEYQLKTKIQLPIPHRNATMEEMVLVGDVMGALPATVEPLGNGEQPTTSTFWKDMKKIKIGRKVNNKERKHQKFPNKYFHREIDESNEGSSDDTRDGESSSENSDESSENSSENNDEDSENSSENNDEAEEENEDESNEDSDENDDDST